MKDTNRYNIQLHRRWYNVYRVNEKQTGLLYDNAILIQYQDDKGDTHSQMIVEFEVKAADYGGNVKRYMSLPILLAQREYDMISTVDGVKEAVAICERYIEYEKKRALPT